MRGPFFVMLAGRPKRTDWHVYVFGDGCTLKQAHASAEAEYRRERKVASNVFIQTQKLAEYETFAEAERFVGRLGELIAEDDPS